MKRARCGDPRKLSGNHKEDGDVLPRFRCKTSGKVVVFAAASSWLCVAAAHAQTTYFRDDHGRTTGRAEQRGDTTYYRDDRGRTLGRAEQRGDTTYFRDDHGRTTGRAEQRGNTTYYRDGRGRTTGRAEQRGDTKGLRRNNCSKYFILAKVQTPRPSAVAGAHR